MTTKHRKPVEALRVPFNCNLAPATKEMITGIQNETKESQGEVVDRAIALLALGEEMSPNPAKKQSRKDKVIQERAASDVTAQVAAICVMNAEVFSGRLLWANVSPHEH